ncbi:DUF2357 domain-containing protein [Psychrobacter sp. 1Y11]|uniref:DUF2357 domain-containing protein n=1 Tax=Psychrobacter sp. 1Y11 TaxID=3457446 RepID=UPI003FD069AC
MPELLRIQTPQFELSIYCSDISKRQATYRQTLANRKEISSQAIAETGNGNSNGTEQARIRFSPPIEIVSAEFMGEPIAQADYFSQTGLIEVLEVKDFIFFENINYQFEWLFFDAVQQAHLAHRSYLINDSFHFSQARHRMPAHLTGAINTANDVGWLRLPLEYKTPLQTHHSTIAFEVLPTKMSLHDDLPAMYQAIDSVFPLWRFSLVEKTEQDAAQSRQQNQFPLLWLANFSHLRTRLEQALKVINQAPHSRLQAHTSYNKAAHLKGKLPARLGAKIKEDFANGNYNHRYPVTKKQLSVDTPENRFIKMVVSTSKKRLANFEHKLRQSNDKRDKQRLSEAFLAELHQWQQPLQKSLQQGFMTEVGRYNGRSRESLVLQQKVGYSAVYRIWQELKFYLEIFDNQSSLSMKSVAETYEVWCFLTLRNILIDELGFEEVVAKKQTLRLNDFFEYQLKDGFAGAFEFERSDGVKAKLAHEPLFTNSGVKVRSYLTSQKPDIVLEVTLPAPSHKHFIWLFDAKYRIKTVKSRYDDDNVDIDASDYVPDDAINQMHRYRDALIRLDQDSNNTSQEDVKAKKSRPVFGAFALYPGYFDQRNVSNPYLNAISEVSIGAFALLPSAIEGHAKNQSGQFWLLDFLREQLGSRPVHNLTTSQVNSPVVAYQANPYQIDKTIQPTQTQRTHIQRINQLEEHLYLQEAARIPHSGMQQVLYPNLIMTIALAGESGRNSEYFNQFKNGLAKWYHLPQQTFIKKYKQHIVNEIRYLALAITDANNTGSKQITKLWPIKSMTLKPRSALTEQQAGKTSNTDKPYYLFELGKPLTLKDSIDNVPHTPIINTMRLTTLNQLQQATKFCELESVYDDALVKRLL